MEILIIVLSIIVFICSVGFIYITTYNTLQFYKSRIEVAENKIDNALRQKYDLLCELNNDIKKVTKNKDYLKEYIDYKNQKLTNYDTDRKLIEGFNLIKELKNDYKELNIKNFNKKLEELKQIDEELTAGKNYFNKNTSDLNMIIRKFPTNIVAKRHNFKIKPYFDNKNMQDAVIDDFKL